jgi:hypothetical protein
LPDAVLLVDRLYLAVPDGGTDQNAAPPGDVK